MAVADRLYDNFPVYLQNADLQTYLGAIGQMFQGMADIMEDGPNEEPGWSAIVDVDRCPSVGLPWLAQLVGGQLPEGATDANARAYIRARPGWGRGTRATMIAAIQFYLTGNKTVVIRERDSSPYHFIVYTYTNETPNSALVNAVIARQKPAGLQYTYTVVAGGTYGSLNASYAASYNAMKAAFTTYNGIRTNTPGT
jgi:hypothetical protein